MSNNGIGFPEHVGYLHPPSLGLTLVKSAVEQINSTVELGRRGDATLYDHIRVMRMQDVGLSVGQFCNNVGTEFTDKDIGDYISGMLAQINGPKGKSWIQTSARPATLPDTGEAVWECEATTRHIHGEDVMNWGVRFKLRASDRSLVNGSTMCIGSG